MRFVTRLEGIESKWRLSCEMKMLSNLMITCSMRYQAGEINGDRLAVTILFHVLEQGQMNF